EFLKLSDAQPEAILDFARCWGVLAICEHGKPRSHGLAHPRRGGYARCEMLGERVGRPWEPLEAWWRYARQARGILNVAFELREGRLGDSADWQAIQEGEPRGFEVGDE